jgi:hypothetical protein
MTWKGWLESVFGKAVEKNQTMDKWPDGKEGSVFGGIREKKKSDRCMENEVTAEEDTSPFLQSEERNSLN